MRERVREKEREREKDRERERERESGERASVPSSTTIALTPRAT